MRHMRWQTLMLLKITAQIIHRSLHHLHILFQLSYITLNTIKPSNLLLNIPHRLKHGPVLVDHMLHQHTQMVDICITHTNSLA